MTERVLGPTGSRSRATRTSLLLMAVMGLVLGVLIGGGGLGAAAPGPSVVDYSQCANGAPGTSAPTTNCDAMINGILNPNNSQYREDQVTFQRAVVSFPTGGSHSVNITYLVRKGDHHAYDSLATWNQTQTTAGPCLGFKGAALTACTTAVGGTADTLPIDPDPLVVNSACTTESTTTSAHQLSGQVFTMFGGDMTSMQYLGSSSDSEGLYQTAKINFTVGAGGGTVYLLFGGHLAAGKTPATGSPRGWGNNCGASDISGGPYHIRLTAVDQESIGSRDNQIMSNAVLPLTLSAIATQPSATATFSATLDDSATVTGNNPTGNVTFRLYGPSATAPDCSTATPIFVKTVALSAVNSTSSTASTTGTAVGTVTGSNVVTVAGTYWWTAQYAGDSQNVGATSACGSESTTITAPGITNVGTS
jgi:hypothetical protein